VRHTIQDESIFVYFIVLYMTSPLKLGDSLPSRTGRGVTANGIQTDTKGTEFIDGLKDMGIAHFIAGIFCTCVPPTIGMLFGNYVLRMNRVLLLGGVAEAQTVTAAMIAVHNSQAPVIGFTVPYALGNIILTTFATVIVLLTS
jgi:putative transport protein